MGPCSLQSLTTNSWNKLKKNEYKCRFETRTMRGGFYLFFYFLEKGSATRVAPGSLNARYRSSSFGRTIFYSSELRTKSRTHTENKFPTQHQHWAKARTLVGGLPTGSANHRESLARSQGRVLSGGTFCHGIECGGCVQASCYHISLKIVQINRCI
jgi:hypothetical protein